MTEEAQRIAIAEWCAWKQSHHKFRVAEVHGWISPLGEWEISPPDYLNDLNAIREALLQLSQDEFQNYLHHLGQVCWAESLIQHTRNIHTATAAQRAEALLRTIGKWKE